MRSAAPSPRLRVAPGIVRLRTPVGRTALAATALLVIGCATTTGSGTSSGAATPAASAAAVVPGARYVYAATPEQAGEYLTVVGGCNDCHTARWAEANGNVAPEDRFTGNPVGYRGPWGTSYAANLRLVTQRMPEDRWVSVLKTAMGGHGDPPMPWMNTRLMSDQDLRAIYRYIRSLGPKGVRMPRGVPPNQEPTTPYVDFRPKQPTAP